ncbi:MAG: XRE family transcriptional regulator, partial [Nocardioides sp.]|uniref:MmyB family transcriptional regulator n=1 Tax=Nocardioides sp. TaxID=35761 RepID=UPI003F110375
STTWFTWLEQGRDINPSRQVVDAVSATLRLTPAEHDYVLALAGFASARSPEAGATTLAAHHQRLLDAQHAAPSFMLSGDWSIIGWNAAYAALYPGVAQVAPERRNLLTLIFTDPYVRTMLPDWESTSRHFLAEYRADVAGLLGRPEHLALVQQLREASPDFAAAWAEHHVSRFASRQRTFAHPSAGELVFEQHSLRPVDAPGTHLVIYLPAPDSPTERAMRTLLAGGAATAG